MLNQQEEKEVTKFAHIKVAQQGKEVAKVREVR